MNFCLSVSRFPFFPYPLLRTHSLLLGWVRPHAKSGKLRRPRRAYTEAPQQNKTVPIPPTTRKPRARRDRGFISAPTACGAPHLLADLSSVVQAEELHQSCASRVASQHCPLCSPPQHPRPSR